MNLPKPSSLRYDELLLDVRKGRLKIPQFQRNFVWDIQKSADLLDSIIKGYPIGSFIVWKTTERLKMIGALGSLILEQPNDNEYINYILDGQQRITSLFVALEGLSIDKTDYSNIYINLLSDNEDKIVTTDITMLSDGEYIKFCDILSCSIVDLVSKYSNDMLKRIETLKKNVENYDFSMITIEDIPINIATEVFTRINIKGQTLTVFEVMCAKIFDKNLNFDLSEKFEDFREELEDVKFDTIPASIILQLISLIITGNCKAKTILSLNKMDVINNWDIACKSLKASIDLVKSTFGVPSSSLMPYDVLLIPIAYYMNKNENKHPSSQHLKYLSDMFWRYSLTFRYNNAVESKLSTDISIINNFMDGKEYKPATYLDLSEKFFKENGKFTIGKCLTKAMLCLYIHNRPKRLDTPFSDIQIDGNQLLKSNSKNYHHFFPKAFMKKKSFDMDYINNIINIVILDDNTNKYKIKDKAPSLYIADLEKDNNQINSSLVSHFIGNIDDFGISADNYDLFFQKRCEWIIEKLEGFLCLDNEIEIADSDVEEIDIQAKDVYNKIWNNFEINMSKIQNGILFENKKNIKSRSTSIINSKINLKLIASLTTKEISMELLVKDDRFFQVLISQQKDFESLVDFGKIIWSDPSSKNKSITIQYNRPLDLFKATNQEKACDWFCNESIAIKEILELFIEDISYEQKNSPSVVTDDIKFTCKVNNIIAVGNYLGSDIGFKILKGSMIRLSTSARGRAEEKRSMLINKNIINKLTEAKGEFLNDYIASSPSEAANIIMGGSNNGWIVWKNDMGATLDSQYRNRTNVIIDDITTLSKNMVVNHKTLGKGIIISLESTYIIIRFNGIEKKFQTDTLISNKLLSC